jgi:TolA-binding protein
MRIKMNFTVCYVIIFSLLFAGCSSGLKKTAKVEKKSKTIPITLDEKIKFKQARKQKELDKRDRDLVLSTIDKKTNVSEPVGSPLIVKKGMKETELFAEVMDRYESNDRIGFELRMNAFKKQFSKSRFMPEVLFMSGMIRVSDREYGSALSDFNKILKSHGESAKASSAMFAKAMTYKKMNLIELSKNTLNQLKTKYASSPESLRAEAELMLF